MTDALVLDNDVLHTGLRSTAVEPGLASSANDLTGQQRQSQANVLVKARGGRQLSERAVDPAPKRHVAAAPSTTTFVDANDPGIGAATASRPVEPTGESQEVLAEWRGYVTVVSESFFAARLNGLRGVGVAGEIEDAEIPIEDVTEVDLPLVRPGSFFTLCVTYESSRNGVTRRVTELRFRRLPTYSRDLLDTARDNARRMSDALSVD